ncbi:MAG: hypothetical protein LBB23_00905 [Rickettsiales bacterium]|nr:hypothetical protein [Rickettsiales bacterium]
MVKPSRPPRYASRDALHRRGILFDNLPFAEIISGEWLDCALSPPRPLRVHPSTLEGN